MACLMIAGVQSCSDSDSDGGAVGNGTVSGIVTDEQENPIDGVKVSLHATGASVTTNSAGEYSLPNVPMTSGIIVYEKEGYETAAVTVTSKRFTDDKANVNVSLVYANAVISGTVYDGNSDGQPLAGVTVKVSDFQKTETDAQGHFELPQPDPSGLYCDFPERWLS